jgi:mannopine transport system substrate-binding protein
MHHISISRQGYRESETGENAAVNLKLRITNVGKFLASAPVFCLVALGAASAQQKEIIFPTTGGAFEQGQRAAWFEPFTKATGIKVTTVTATDAEQRTRAQAMVQSGNVTWDTIANVDIVAESEQNRAITVDMTEFCKQFKDRKDLNPKACTAAGVMTSLNGTLLVYNGDKFKGKKPETWADFWNVNDFPGPRALPNLGDPWRVLAAALMADGVPSDKLFPLDLERALKKLDQIKPHVQLWWKTGDQSQQGFRNGDYVIGMIWGTRATALRKENQPVEMSWDGAFMLADMLQLLKGAPHPQETMELMKFYLDNPEVQARFTEKFSITPPSQDAIARMDEAAKKNIPTNPEIFKKLVTADAAWINANREKMLTHWNEWLQK